MRKREIQMERMAWKGHIKPGCKAEYVKRYNEIWPEMVEVLKAAEICNYTIFVNGEELFGYYECEKGIAFAEKTQVETTIRLQTKIHAYCAEGVVSFGQAYEYYTKGEYEKVFLTFGDSAYHDRWQRKYSSEKGSRDIVLLMFTERHMTDWELYQVMKSWKNSL